MDGLFDPDEEDASILWGIEDAEPFQIQCGISLDVQADGSCETRIDMLVFQGDRLLDAIDLGTVDNVTDHISDLIRCQNLAMSLEDKIKGQTDPEAMQDIFDE